MEVAVALVVAADGSEQRLEMLLDLLARVFVGEDEVVARMVHNALGAEAFLVILAIIFDWLAWVENAGPQLLDASIVYLIPEGS